MRTFDSGATRDTNDDKLDYKGFRSHAAVKRFAEYMHKHRKQADGSMRASDNWKKGIPMESYVESAYRHMEDFVGAFEEGRMDDADELACAVWFNVQGFLHEGRHRRNSNPVPTPCTHEHPCNECRNFAVRRGLPVTTYER